jgi:ABC-type multidrug transport system ATPase subunit
MPMKISLCKTGKRYQREWIFRHFDYEFESGNAYAITGSNGSGKSTLLQIIAGAVVTSEGSITYEYQGHALPGEQVYRHLSWAAPYIELVEEMTLREFLRFHTQFKPFVNGLTSEEAAAITGLEKAMDKLIVNFSSGMKQRLRLAQAFFSDTALLLLDEPTSNLDRQGIDLYHRLIENHTRNRLTIISSNDPDEYRHCPHVISVSDYKPVATRS